MALDYPAPCGIQRRVQLAARWIPDTANLAALLGVSESVVVSILTDPQFTPTAPDLATMNANLADVARDRPHETHRTFGTGREVLIYESELWGQTQFDNAPVPFGSSWFTWVYCGGSAQSGVSTSEPYLSDSFTPQEAATIEVGFDWERLLALRCYVEP